MPTAFDYLRTANRERQAEYDPEEKITTLFRAVELGGEAGEALNEVKKLERERLQIAGSRTTIDKLAQELADIVICVDLIGLDFGIDLFEAIKSKFNATSEKVGLKTRI